MSARKNFLSIGQVSNYAGVSIDSLRYYEKIGLLKPSFVDPGSKYRYYAFDQIYLVYIISLCIELNIPLRDLKKFIKNTGTINYSGLLASGKSIAKEKIAFLTQGIKLIEQIEEKIAQTENHPEIGKPYTRTISEKYYYVKACKSISQTTKPFEAIKFSLGINPRHEPKPDSLYAELLEYGYLCLHHNNTSTYYMFAELTKQMATEQGPIVTTGPLKTADILFIEKGKYHCIKNQHPTMPKHSDIFSNELNGANRYIAIETDIFSEVHTINSPLRELRVITQG